MRKKELISWIIFLVGILWKIYHLPGSSLFLILGCLLMLIFNTVYFVKNFKVDIIKSLYKITYTFITIYVLFRILYLPYGQLVFAFTFLTGITTLALHIGKKEKTELKHVLLTVYFISFLTISFIHADRYYYLFNRKAILNEENVVNGYQYRVLDRYSWFLYLAKKYDEAERINKESIVSLKNYIENNPNDIGIEEALITLERHGGLIRNRNWKQLNE